MLSIHNVSIMMRIFYIDWQQHWECDRTMNIGANAHGERTVSTKQPQVWQTWPPLTVGLPVTSERYWASFQVTRLFHKASVSRCDHFFAAAYVFVVWNFTRLITRLKRFFCLFFFTSIWWGSTQLQRIYYLRVYWSLGRRGYFGVSNVALVVVCRCASRSTHHSACKIQQGKFYIRQNLTALTKLRVSLMSAGLPLNHCLQYRAILGRVVTAQSHILFVWGSLAVYWLAWA